MLVYSLVKVTNYIELMLDTLKKSGFNSDNISVVHLSDCKPPKANIIDSIYSSDSISVMDGISLTASVGMVLGVIYGSVLPLGPVAVGLLGMAAGAGAGFALDRIKHRNINKGSNSYGDIVILAVMCRSEEEAMKAEKIMTEYHSAAIGRGRDFQTPPPKL